jgi:hypothetical protein
MALTQQEFLDIVQTVDQDGEQVHIWYDSNTSQIRGVTIPTVLNGQNILGYLQQVQQIIIPVSNTETVVLEVLTKFFINPNYYFVTVQPYYILGITDNILNIDNFIIFLPDILGLVFTNGDYNAVFNNIQDTRQSEYIRQSTSQVLAFVQDSLYSDTGWVRGRYEGTKTTIQDFATISPILEGGEFEGSYFPQTLTDEYIFNLPNSEKVFNKYFFSGDRTKPEYTLITTDLKRVSSFPQNTTSDSFIVTGSLTNETAIRVGDLIRLGSGSTEIPSQEILKVTSVENLTNITQEITVTRKWNQTPEVTQQDSGELINPGRGMVYKIDPIRVFNLNRNIVEIPSRGRIQVKSNQDIVDIDELGFVVTGSNYTVPTP